MVDGHIIENLWIERMQQMNRKKRGENKKKEETVYIKQRINKCKE